MKQILLLLFLFVGTFSIAQMESDMENYSIDFDLEKSEFIEEITFTAGDEGQDFIWKVESVDAPEDWVIFVCDFNTCYPPNVTEVTAEDKNVLSANETKKFSIHMRHNGNCTEGSFKITYSDLDNNELFSNTLTYTCTTSNDETDIASISIFPNPVSEQFKLDGDLREIESIEIFNLVGKKVKAFDRNSVDQYNVSDLNMGRYFVRLIGRDEQSVKVVRMVKK